MTGDDYLTSIVIADADKDGTPELYACSRDDNAVHCFDARTGNILWKTPMVGVADVYPSSSLAVGDVDQDGFEEVLVPDAVGYVYCLTHTGQVAWVFETEKWTHAAVSLGDVDGDGEVEALIASGDHHLYCVSADGRLEWKFAADRRLIYPATIVDVDQDGETDIVFCGSDHMVRCMTQHGRYAPALIPWPSRRFDAAQSGSSFGKRPAPAAEVEETRAMLNHGGFEMGKAVADPKEYPPDSSVRAQREHEPRGWQVVSVDAGTLARDTGVKLSGTASAKAVAGNAPLVFRSEPIAVDRPLRSVQASIAAKGGTPAACLEWSGPQGVVRTDPLTPRVGSEEWTRLECGTVACPRDARWVTLVCTTASGTTTWWDEATITGGFVQSRTAKVLTNQVGYDVGAPKRFTAESNFAAASTTFEIVGDDGAVIFTGALQPAGRIQGAYGPDWGYEYWRGDFSSFDTPGTYRVRIRLDGIEDVSWPFDIGPNLLWERTAAPAYRFFYYQRCGMAVPGFHGACHLDDAASPDGARQHELWGGWHDAGDYNTYDNAPYLLGLACVYGLRKSAFDQWDADGNGHADLLDEILWGGDHERRMLAPDGSAFGAITSGYGFWGPPELETDNLPGTGDERRINGAETGNDSACHAAALAKIACWTDAKGPWLDASKRALDWALRANRRGLLQFAAALDLYAATQDSAYATLAKDLLPAASIEAADALRQYDSMFGTDHRAELRPLFVARANEMLALADNPFGVYTHGPKERPNFFGTPADVGGWHVGNSSYILNAAAIAAQAYEYEPDARYVGFVYDQLNWTLGNNPYGISLMEGQGHAFPPSYHHRYTFSGVPRGAVPGSVVNGITWRGPGDDRPYFDMRGLDIADFESNEVWLPHNVAYLTALAQLSCARQPK